MAAVDKVLAVIQEVAAEVIVPRFRGLSAGQVAEKSPGDVVTIADREAEQRLISQLGSMFPDAIIVGEETCFERPQLEFCLGGVEHAFTVDPVDGTRNFVAGNPDYAVMVCEVVRGEQVRGWIWQPEHRVAYVAEKGAGAWRNGERMERRVATARPPVGATDAPDRLGFMGGGLLAPLQRSAWCCGVDYPLLAGGVTDYLTFSHVHPWDHLPGAVLLGEVGGVSKNWQGQAYTPAWTGPGLLSAVDAPTWELVRQAWGPTPRTSTVGTTGR